MKKQTNDNNRIKYYTSFTTSELEKILKIDFLSANGDHLTNEEIEIILNIISDRSKSTSTSKEFDIDKSWNSFKNNYLPFAKRGELLFETPKIDFKKENNKYKFGRYKNIAAATICVIMIGLFSTTTTAQNFFNYVASWTKDTFWFDHTEQTTYSKQPNNIYSNLGIFFDSERLTPDMLPTYLPDGYTFDLQEGYETEQIKFLTLFYTGETEDLFLSLNIVYFYENINTPYEKDSSDITIYQKNGIDYYIMGNLNTNTAIWKNNSFEFQIDGTISREELTKIIDSIPSY